MADQADSKQETKKTFPKLLILLVLLGVGVGYFFKRFEIIKQNGQITIRSRDGKQTPPDNEPIKPNIKMPPLRNGRGDRIQIATFNVGPLDDIKLASDRIVDHLANTIRNFDLIALQDIRVHDPGQLDRITKKTRHARSAL